MKRLATGTRVHTLGGAERRANASPKVLQVQRSEYGSNAFLGTCPINDAILLFMASL